MAKSQALPTFEIARRHSKEVASVRELLSTVIAAQGRYDKGGPEERLITKEGEILIVRSDSLNSLPLLFRTFFSFLFAVARMR